jgi:hypothetical protein
MSQEVYARLSELEQAAAVLRSAALRLEESQAQARAILEELLALGIAPALSSALLESSVPACLHRLADGLLRAHADLGSALATPDFGRRLRAIRAGIERQSPIRPQVFRWLEAEAAERQAALTAASLPPLTAYLSRRNAPLYHALLAQREDLQAAQAQLEGLRLARQQAQAEHDALRARLLSFDPQRDLSREVRLNALADEVRAWDERLSEAEGHLRLAQADADLLALRLEVVRPQAGADLAIIRGLEDGQTSPWVIDNTQGCVRYIAQRVPIPDALARDAHLWDEQVLANPQWGIGFSERPLAGSILVMETDHPYAHDVYGHVMYVEQVDADGTVWVTDNDHPQPVRLNDLTQESRHIHYLVLPWHTYG